MRNLDRRSFLATGLLGTAGVLNSGLPAQISRTGNARIKLSCNAYSFNTPLRDGKMKLAQLIDYCARLELDAVDLTGYYFEGYPNPPSPEELSRIKRRAYLLGLDISGTGVRNDFTVQDPANLAKNIELVKSWIEVAEKLGAPALRIFAGRTLESEENRRTLTDQVAGAISECTEYAGERGVVLVLQNHFEFLKTAEQTIGLLKQVDSEWLALNLDIGSFRSDDPYREIAAAAPYAATWQIKENVYRGEAESETDLSKIAGILRSVNFRGYILIETLGGDPFRKFPLFCEKVREAIQA